MSKNAPGQGPKRKPTVIKMRDNARIKKFPDTEPQPLVVLPTCPDHLSAKAKEVWSKFGPMLLSVGLITEIDEANFGMWCSAYAELQDLEVKMQKPGFNPIYFSDKGHAVANPLIWIVYKVRAQVDKYGSRFGMSPQERSGISIKTRNEANPYRELQKRRKTNSGQRKDQTGKAKKTQ